MKGLCLKLTQALCFSLLMPMAAMAATNESNLAEEFFAAEGDSGEEDFPPDLFLLKMEMTLYVSIAKTAAESDLPEDSPELAQIHNEMMKAGERIADIYFRNATETIRVEMDNDLSRTLAAERSLRNYFIYLGNGFVNRAQAFIEQRAEEEKKIRFYSTIGGVLVGAAGGGGYLYFKSRSGALALKDYLIATTAVVGGGVLGNLGVSKAVNTYVLPADLSVRSSRDFVARYPKGEDFIEELDRGNEDLHAIEDLVDELDEEIEG